jgi:peptidoglycan/LPS O-acetylase OafA/YrhL
MKKLKFRKEITSLRAFAIIPVVLYHLEVSIFQSGYLGVDVFFVISGYLISHKIIFDLETQNFSFINFYKNRIKRLAPALIFVILVINFTAYSLYSGQDLNSILSSSVFSLFYLSNFYFLNNTNYFDTDIGSQLYLHTWSLSIEEQFYIFMPVFLFFMIRKKIKFPLTVVSFLIAVSLFASIYVSVQYFNFKFYLLPFRIWEFLLGTLVAFFLIKNKYKGSHSDLISSSLLFLLLYQFVYPYNSLNHPGLTSIITCFSTALLIVFLERADNLNKLINLKPIYFIGLISYSLYLWHDPIIKINNKIDFIQHDIYLILVILVISSFSYYFIENFFRYKASNNILYFAIVSSIFVILSFAFFVNRLEEESSLITISSVKDQVTFSPNTTDTIGLTNMDVKKIRDYSEKSIFQEMFTQYYDQKSVSASETSYDLDVGLTGDYLLDVCFIQGYGFAPTAEECLIGYDNKKHNILFVGDSTAHNYFMGVKSYVDSKDNSNYSVNTLSVTGCVPFIDEYAEDIRFRGKEEKCEKSYKAINNILENYKFDTIFVSYRYKYFYEHKSEDFIPTLSYFGFEDKLIQLSKKTDLYLIGPSLLFIESPKDVNLQTLKNENKINVFSADNLDEDIFEIDLKLKTRMKNENITYIPMLDYLCEEQFCLNFLIRDGKLYPLLTDTIHLSIFSSMFIAENLFSEYINFKN